MKKVCPFDEKIERRKEIINFFEIKNGQEFTKFYSKSEVSLLKCLFQNCIKVSNNDFDIKPLNSQSRPGYTWQCRFTNTDIRIQTLQDKDLILLLEISIRGNVTSEMSDRYVKSDEIENILYIDAYTLYVRSMSQPLPHDENNFNENVKLEDILNTPDDSDSVSFVNVNLGIPHEIKNKTKNFPFCPLNIWSRQDNFSKHTSERKVIS